MTKEESAMAIAFIQVHAVLGAPRDKTVNLMMENVEEPQRHDARLFYESVYDVAAASSPERKKEILFGPQEKFDKFIAEFLVERVKERTKKIVEEAAETEEEEAENEQS